MARCYLICATLVTLLLVVIAQAQNNGEHHKLIGVPVEDLIEAVEEHPWTVLTFGGGRKRNVNFVPRLGRELREENIENEFRDAEVISQRSTPFAPRLGKRINYFDPRLGKRDQ